MSEVMEHAETREPQSGCVNAPNLGLWRVGANAWRLGRRRDAALMPGTVYGNLDRARRCWHALNVLHTDAPQIIEDAESDERSGVVMLDWSRFTD
jgi:hypothetical protein